MVACPEGGHEERSALQVFQKKMAIKEALHCGENLGVELDFG